MAGLGTALAELRSAADGRRNRDRPSGSLRLLTAYLMGFTIIRTVATMYAYFANIGKVADEAGTYNIAVVSTVLACLPLVAGLLLSRGRVDAERRLALLPMGTPSRLVIAAVGPAVAELPTFVMAAALPFVAASPIAAYSPVRYLRIASWFVVVGASAAFALGSTIAMLASLMRTRGGSGHGKSILFCLALGAIFATNPRPVVTNGTAHIVVFGSTIVDIAALGPLAAPFDRPNAAAIAAFGAMALACFAAIMEDVVRRRAAHARVGFFARPGHDRATAHGKQKNRGTFTAMLAVVDRKRNAAWSFAATSALAAASLAERANPAIPFAVAAVSFAVRVGSAMAFVATDGPTTRRLALVPARPGSAERVYLAAALVVAAAIAAPPAAAGLIVAAWRQ